MSERKHSAAGSSTVRSAVGTSKEVLGDAQKRVQRAFRGDRKEDVLLKSVVGAVAATFFLRIIRQTPIGAVLVRVIPMIAFVGLYDRFSRAAK